MFQETAYVILQTREAKRSCLPKIWSFLREVRRVVLLPKKEPSAIFPQEICHFFWQLLEARCARLETAGFRPSRDCVRAIWISARASDTPSRHNDAKQHCVTIEFFSEVWGRFLARKSPQMIVRAAAALAESRQ
jgi:hypothetical protein